MICCGQDVSPDDTIEMVYVRNSRDGLQTKLFIYSRYDVIYTVCLWQMLIGDRLCLSDPRWLYGLPRCTYVGYGRYSFVDIAPLVKLEYQILEYFVILWFRTKTCLYNMILKFDEK